MGKWLKGVYPVSTGRRGHGPGPAGVARRDRRHRGPVRAGGRVTFSLVARDAATRRVRRGDLLVVPGRGRPLRAPGRRRGRGRCRRTSPTPGSAPGCSACSAEAPTRRRRSPPCWPASRSPSSASSSSLDTAGRAAIHSGARRARRGRPVRRRRRRRGRQPAGHAGRPAAAGRGLAGRRGPVETRLLAALGAAVAAGGEAGPVHSAGLSVVNGSGWRVTDLRVDWSDDPLADLTALLDVWLPQRDDYIARALDPAAAPSYGVPG